MPSFHEKLRQLMELRGLTQIEVAKTFGVSQRAISGWINGALPRPAMTAKIASFFEVSTDVLKNDNLKLPPVSQLYAVPSAISHRLMKTLGEMSYGELTLFAQKLIDSGYTKVAAEILFIADWKKNNS